MHAHVVEVARAAEAAALKVAADECEANARDWYGTDIFRDVDSADLAAVRSAMQAKGKGHRQPERVVFPPSTDHASGHSQAHGRRVDRHRRQEQPPMTDTTPAPDAETIRTEDKVDSMTTGGLDD